MPRRTGSRLRWHAVARPARRSVFARSRAAPLVLALPILALIGLGCSSDSPGSRMPVSATSSAAATLQIAGSDAAQPLVKALATAFERDHPEIHIEILADSRMREAVRGVREGRLDVAMVDRALAPDEAPDQLEYHPFARDAAVLAVRGPATVTSLSSRQVRDIFGGSTTRWDQLGGGAGPIIVLERPVEEAVRARFIQPLVEPRGVAIRTITLIQTPEMTEAIATTPNVLGYGPLSTLRLEQARDVRIVTLDGVSPSRRTVADGSYRWHITFALVIRQDASPTLRRFVAFVEAESAHAVLEQFDVAAFDQ